MLSDNEFVFAKQLCNYMIFEYNSRFANCLKNHCDINKRHEFYRIMESGVKVFIPTYLTQRYGLYVSEQGILSFMKEQLNQEGYDFDFVIKESRVEFNVKPLMVRNKAKKKIRESEHFYKDF